MKTFWFFFSVKACLATLLFWVIDVKLLVLSCAPESANSTLKFTAGWCQSHSSLSEKISTLMSGSTQTLGLFSTPPRAWVCLSCFLHSPLPQWMLEGQSRAERGNWQSPLFTLSGPTCDMWSPSSLLRAGRGGSCHVRLMLQQGGGYRYFFYLF